MEFFNFWIFWLVSEVVSIEIAVQPYIPTTFHPHFMLDHLIMCATEKIMALHLSFFVFFFLIISLREYDINSELLDMG